MGVRATYVVNDKVTLMGNVVNGWNNVVENNGAKSFGAQIAVKPVPQVSIVQNHLGGPEGTLTFEVKPVDNLLWRIEYRRELSGATVFQNKGGDLHTNRNSVAFGVLYAFTSKPQ
jgi:Putative beta-barrel porin-2, OmpL-like. bbp2